MAEKPTLVKFEGKVRWATIPPRDARPPHKDYTTDLNKDDLNYQIEVECDEELFKRLKKAGIPRLTELKEDEATGISYIRLKASKRKTNGTDEPWNFADIAVYGEDGEALTENVGNGSEAIVIAELADIKKGKVLRLRSVRITKLIPFEDRTDDTEMREMLGLSGKKEEKVKETVEEESYF